MLRIQRRHSDKCPDRANGPNFLKCRGRCCIRIVGAIEGRRVRLSVRTRDLQRAMRRLMEIEAGGEQTLKPRKPLDEAVKAFLAAHDDLAVSTYRKYGIVLKFLVDFANGRGVTHVEGLTLELLDLYRASRDITPVTWSKELPILRQFLSHCVARDWTKDNPALRMRLPRNARPAPVEPFTREEVIRIIAASQAIGRGAYERLRAHAMTLLFRYTALRISDVAALERSRVANGEIFIRAEKNGKPVRLPIPGELQAALDRLPQPRGAASECPYFFWSGHGSKDSAIRDVRRTMEAVFRKADVASGHPHKFRHTLGVEVLVSGGGIEDVASILGDTPATIRRHYAPWTMARQERISSLMQTVFSGPNLAQTQQQPASC